MFGGYSVGIEIHLVDHVTSAMGRVNQAMIHAQGNTVNFQKALTGLHTQMSRLQAAGDIGSTMFSGAAGAINSMIDPAKEYAQAITQANLAGIEHLDIQKNIKAAWDTAREVPGSGATGNIKTQTELFNIVGPSRAQMQETRDMLTPMKKIEEVLKSVVGNRHAAEDQILAGVRSLDMQGKAKPEDVIHGLTEQTRVAQGMGNRVPMSMWPNVTNYEHAMKTQLSDTFKYRFLPVLMEEAAGKFGGAGGSRVGTMVSAFGRMAVQDRMSNRTRGQLAEVGLIGDDGHVIGRDMARTDPQKWAAMAFEKIRAANPGIKPDQMAGKVIETFSGGNQLMVDFMIEMLTKTQNGQFDRWDKIYSKIPGLEESYQIARNNPENVENSLQTAWTDVMVSLGTALTPFIPYLNIVANILEQIGGFFIANPWAAQLVVITIAVTGFVGGLIALGAAAGVTALILPMLGLGIGALGPIIEIVVLSIAGLSYAFFMIAQLGPKLGELMYSACDSIGKSVTDTWNNIVKSTNDFTKNFVDPLIQGFSNLENVLKPLMFMIDPIGFVARESANAIGSVTTNTVQPIRPGSANQGKATKTSLNIQQGAINIHPAPGQSPEDIAKAVQEMLIQVMQSGLLTNAGNTTGLLFGHEPSY